MNLPASAEQLARPAFVPGVFRGMPAADYFAVEALSQSGCKKILQSALHYLFERTHPAEPTATMRFGTAVHDGVLEPAAFAERVACAPDVNRRTKDGKAELDAFAAANAGRLVLDAEDYARAQGCIAAVRAHPAASALLAGAEIESSLFWNDAKHGVPCKARLDARNHGGVVDLKTTQDASPEAFARSIATFRYHLQAAFYFSGCEHLFNETPRFFAFIAVESEPPHAVACYSLPGNAVLAGAHLAALALERYAEAVKSGEWKGYPTTIETIALPAWATKFNY